MILSFVLFVILCDMQQQKKVGKCKVDKEQKKTTWYIF